MTESPEIIRRRRIVRRLRPYHRSRRDLLEAVNEELTEAGSHRISLDTLKRDITAVRAELVEEFDEEDLRDLAFDFRHRSEEEEAIARRLVLAEVRKAEAIEAARAAGPQPIDTLVAQGLIAGADREPTQLEIADACDARLRRMPKPSLGGVAALLRSAREARESFVKVAQEIGVMPRAPHAAAAADGREILELFGLAALKRAGDSLSQQPDPTGTKDGAGADGTFDGLVLDDDSGG